MREIIKLTQDVVRDEIWMNEADFEFDGEEYILHDQLESNMDDNGTSHPFIYKRKSDGKFFMIVIELVRYGYEVYNYEDFANDCELFEVELKTKTIEYWGSV